MAQEWFVDEDGAVVGPFPAKQLRAMAQAGRLAPDTRVSLDRAKWFRASQVKGLFATPAASPVAVAPPTPPTSTNRPIAPGPSTSAIVAPAPVVTPISRREVDALAETRPTPIANPAFSMSATDSPATVPAEAPSRDAVASPANAETQAFGPTPTDDAIAEPPAAAPATGDDPIDAEIRRTLRFPLDAVPGYEILRVLGRGGMGVVYAARHLKLDRVVAIKTLLVNKIESPTMLARFEQEARTIARLRHVNVVNAYDFGQHDGRLYLVLELLEGESLEHVLERGETLDEATAWSIARQAASGLAHANQLGIVHRDVKPANLMLVAPPDGLAMPAGLSLVKVTDFGIALLQAEGAASTRLTGQFVAMGTPLYMAPEQASGEAVDGRADIYALGATIYHLLSGRPPYDGQTPIQLVLAKLNHPPAPLAASHDVSSETDRLLADMLASDKNERIADYETLVARIDALPCFQGLAAVRGSTAIGLIPRPPIVSADPSPTKSNDARATSATGDSLPFASEDVRSSESAVAAPTASPAKNRIVAIGGLLAVAAAITLATAFAFRGPALPDKPLRMTAGYEQPLFDGQGLGQWLPAQGLWTPATDAEGGTVLKGSGLARRPIPPLPSFAVSLSVERSAAKVVELRFGVRPGSPTDAPCYALRLADGRATLVEVVPGSPDAPLSTRKIDLPPIEEGADRAPYVALRIEKQGDVWWAFCEEQPLGAARVHADEVPEIRLAVSGGHALFEDVILSELTAPK